MSENLYENNSYVMCMERKYEKENAKNLLYSRQLKNKEKTNERIKNSQPIYTPKNSAKISIQSHNELMMQV